MAIIKTDSTHYNDIVDELNILLDEDIKNEPSEIADRIKNITTLKKGTADASAIATDITAGKTAYVNGEKIIGNVEDGDIIKYGKPEPILTTDPSKIFFTEGVLTPKNFDIETNIDRGTGSLIVNSQNLDLVKVDSSPYLHHTITPVEGGKGGDRTKINIYFKGDDEIFRKKLITIDVYYESLPEPFKNWGDSNAVGDSSWWNNLKISISKSTKEERLLMLGKIKKISLSTPILGSTEVFMRCIGVDQDGEKTLTFQAVNALAEPINFGTDRRWENSNAKNICDQFYNACSAKNAILTVSKGTCIGGAGYRDGAVNYTDVPVFLLSGREYGFDQISFLSIKNSTVNKAECTRGFNETYNFFTDFSWKDIPYRAGDSLGNINEKIPKTEIKCWERSIVQNQYSGGSEVGIVQFGWSSPGSPVENYEYAFNENENAYILPAFVIGI